MIKMVRQNSVLAIFLPIFAAFLYKPRLFLDTTQSRFRPHPAPRQAAKVGSAAKGPAMNQTRRLEAPFAVGVVARLTGLSVHVLRSWERRYGAVQPQRTPRGSRRYTEADVARLRLLGTAVDNGHPISALAPLSDASISALLEQHGHAPELPYAEVLDAIAQLDAREVDAAPLEVVDQAARRGDEDIGAAVQLAELLVERDAADQQEIHRRKPAPRGVSRRPPSTASAGR